MGFDTMKLAKMVARGAPLATLNEEHMESAVRVMQELDPLPLDFDITEVETRILGPGLPSTTSARIAKIIYRTHSRGPEWVEKWNDRVLSTPDPGQDVFQPVPVEEVTPELTEAFDKVVSLQKELAPMKEEGIIPPIMPPVMEPIQE